MIQIRRKLHKFQQTWIFFIALGFGILSLISTTQRIQAEPMNNPVLQGTWQVEKTQGLTKADAQQMRDVTFTFKDDALIVHGLCNQLLTHAKDQNATFHFGMIMNTLKMCAPEVMSAERTVTAFLSRPTHYEVTKNTLHLWQGQKTSPTQGVELVRIPNHAKN